MSVLARLRARVLEPTVVRYYEWRGDPVARLLRPRTTTDPYPVYADVRSRGLMRSPLGVWVTANHSTVSGILRDRRFSASPEHQPGYRPPTYAAGDPRADLPASDMLTMDPPDHTRLRRLVSSAFTPKAIAELEPWIRETTGHLLDRLDPSGFDLVDAFAFPLPIAVICRLLGVPAEDQAKFRVWGHEVAATLEPTTQPAEMQARDGELALTAYLRDLVSKRRDKPDDSILSALIAAEEEGDHLTSREVVSTALLILVAGFETTVNLIGNGTVALLGEREQWDRLRNDPALAPDAVEELLRYDSPVQLTSRMATEDVDIDSATIRHGQSVITLIGGANRDADAFSEPDQLLIGRPDASRHLSFSLGIHHCLGASLARLEGRIAFEQLAVRFPGLTLAGKPVRRQRLVLRGFETVPVRAA